MVAKIRRIIKAAASDSKRLEKFHRNPLLIKTRNYRNGGPAAVETESPEERRPG
jgi:hypothetical protein